MRGAAREDKDIVSKRPPVLTWAFMGARVRSRYKPPQTRIGLNEAAGRNLEQGLIGNRRRLIPIGRFAAPFVDLRQFDQRHTVQIEPYDRDLGALPTSARRAKAAARPSPA